MEQNKKGERREEQKMEKHKQGRARVACNLIRFSKILMIQLMRIAESPISFASPARNAVHPGVHIDLKISSA